MRSSFGDDVTTSGTFIQSGRSREQSEESEPRDCCLIALSALIVRATDRSRCVGNSLRHGITSTEITEVMHHLALYAGRVRVGGSPRTWVLSHVLDEGMSPIFRWLISPGLRQRWKS